jgi:Cys-tRNA(Pro)/Cys-tRNA(Cys) deacylase
VCQRNLHTATFVRTGRLTGYVGIAQEVDKQAMKAATPALALLATRDVPHHVHQLHISAGEDGYGKAAARSLGVDERRVFKTLLARADGTPVVAIVPVSGSLALKALARARGAKRCEMMAPLDAERLTGYVVGGISPLGQRQQLATVLDQSALEFDTIFVSGGRRDLDIELAPTDLVSLCAALVAPISG